MFPDGRGLPAGSGTAAKGKDIFKEPSARCATTIRRRGREGRSPALGGGRGNSIINQAIGSCRRLLHLVADDEILLWSLFSTPMHS